MKLPVKKIDSKQYISNNTLKVKQFINNLFTNL